MQHSLTQSMHNNNNIRQRLIQQRKQLTVALKNQMSQQICDRILSSACFTNSKVIGIYSSINNEVDLSRLFKQGKTFALPVIASNASMFFVAYNKNHALILNKFNIPEPAQHNSINPESIDLCLLPLVGFSRHGNRLGMGGGYYDRYFANNQSHKKATILAGIAYDFQQDDTIQGQTWDVPLDMIFTNKEVINCAKNSTQ